MAENTKPPGNQETPPLRDEKGRFPPGVSGSRNGGRRKMSEAALTLLGDAEVPAIKKLIDALEAESSFVVGAGDNATLATAPDWGHRIKAANSLLDRFLGKPVQSVTGEDGQPLTVSIDLANLLGRLAGG